VYNYSTSYSGTLYKAVNGHAVAETQYDPSTTYYGSVNGGYTKLTIKSYSGTIYSPKYDRIRTITRPYGAKTIDDFPVVGDDGTIYNGVSWSPSGSAIYNVELMSIQTMPNEDITFRWLREATGKYMHYYLEASGAEDEVGFATRTWEGRTYYEYYKQAHNYDRLIFSVDVSPIDGYNRNVENSDPKFDGNGQISGNIPTNTYFYYNRDAFETIFLDSYEHRDSYIQSRSILFKSTMQDEVDNVEADVAFPKHDGYYFSGWYMDDACTIRVFFHEPSESEKDETKDEEGNYHYEKIDRMPAFPLTVYAGWKPVRYKAIFDPNGGELGGKSGSEINSYESMLEVAHGDTLPEYEDMPRDYVRAGVGSAPTHGYVKDDSTLSYLYRENVNDGERHYVYKQGAYTLVGWHRIHADGREDAKPFTFDTPITDRNTETFPGESLPVIQLRAKWRRSGGFEMVYNANDGDTIVTEPIDEEDYVEGSHAVAMVPVDAPAGKTLDYWVDSLYDFSKPVDDEANRGHSFKPNELVPVSEDIATEASDGTMLVILTAVYRDLNPNTHMMADYIFRVEDNTGGYDIYYLQTIAAGETLVAPVPPEKENYKFTGWYYDTAATRPFKGFGVIDSPVYTTLYAGFKAVYTVNYYLTNTNTGGKTSIVLATQYYTAGEKLDTRHVVHPTDPDHYVLRWRDDADSDPGYFYQSSTVITVNGNMDLFAVLHERNYLHFDSGNGTYVDDEEIPSRGWPVRPADPTRKGYIFEGWYTEKDGGSLYDFDKTLDEAGLDKDNPVLYARWRVDTTNRQKGDIHVIFWAQTADHPVDASSDTVHYQMLCHYDIEDMGYGSYTKEELKSYLAAYTDGSQYDIINTVKTAKANGSDTITYFVEDTLGYKGNNADIIGSWVPNDHIDELNRYFVFSDSKSDGSVTVDDTDSAVLNIRFDLRTFYLEFVPAGKTEIHYAGKIYPTDGSDNYKIPIWLNRPIAHEWPIEDTAEGIPDELAHFEWKDSATLFYSWLMSYEQKYVRPAGSSTVLQTQTNEPHRTPISMTDKLIIDTVIANGTNSTLTLTPESKSPGSVPKTAVVHYLVRNGNTNTFTELPEMQTRISVETKLVPTAQQTGNITNHADYYRFVASVCRVSGHPSQHNGSEYYKFAYRHLEPAAISGYKILENEYAHQGDLLTVDGNQDDGKKDNANMSLLYNLVSNRIAFAQAVFSKSDPIYDAYF
ncbi:MAG: InlB B-repeat-containing protein, partial [Lachnospiraceae bacterium]|nr:InlB B-repeat-containing protein [Lachnospiraceae bacterium]